MLNSFMFQLPSSYKKMMNDVRAFFLELTVLAPEIYNEKFPFITVVNREQIDATFQIDHIGELEEMIFDMYSHRGCGVLFQLDDRTDAKVADKLCRLNYRPAQLQPFVKFYPILLDGWQLYDGQHS